MGDSVNIVVQSGGKLIGQGAYGCIFNPPLVCKGAKRAKRGFNKLGKITELSDIANEIHAAKLLGKFPDAKKYCILPEVDTLCKPAPINTQKEKDMDDCDALAKYGYEEMMQYDVEYGGKTLRNTIQTMNLSVGTFPFFDLMRNLLEIGAFLVLHGCIHNDIHGNNIVVNKKYHPRIIDFGRTYMHNMINSKLIDELAAFYNPDLGQLTPECTAQHGLAEGVPFERILEDLYMKKSGLIYAEKILGIGRKDQIKEFKSFWASSNAIQTGDWVTFYRLYWPVVDSWAIGHNIIGILRRLFVSKQFTDSKEWMQKQAIVKGVLRGILQASPRKRMDAVEALAMYDPMNSLITSATGKAWLEKKASL